MRRVIFTPSLWTHSFTNYLRFPLQLSSFCGGPNAGAQGARWRSGGRQMMALVWFRRAEVCLHLPGRPMAPGQPARAPIPPSLAVCAERPFGFHALTVWISRRRSMTWAIGDLCRFSLLNLGSLGRFFAQCFELCAVATLARSAAGTLCSARLCEGDTVPMLRVGGGGQEPAAARVLRVILSVP